MVITKKVYIPQKFYLNVTKNKTPVSWVMNILFSEKMKGKHHEQNVLDI